MRHNEQHVDCSECGEEISLFDAVDAGIDLATGELVYICKDCAEEEEE